ncbi:biotin/lipoyl-containing protein, partial [Aeromonas hydrophila]|uniref:biotin/lipoyl-containing protein n=1 Tax=Aeromonas hydrophila TaxID=644 RepID=UPI001112176B
MITLESDKASMDVPAPKGGKVVKILVKEGDTVSEGDDILELEAEGGGDTSSDASDEQEAPKEEAPKQEASEQQAPKEAAAAPKAASGGTRTVDIVVPDLGDSEAVPIIEMAVAVGDEVDEEDALITLESDKATMDIPSPYKGKVVELSVKEGDTVSEGDLIGYLEVAGAKPAPKAAKAEAPAAPKADKAEQKPEPTPAGTPSPEAQMAAHKPSKGAKVHAGPAVRLLAREFGVDQA